MADFDAWTWGYLVSSLAEVTLGAWVFFASPSSRINRGFALYLFATGLGDFVQAFLTQTRPDDAVFGAAAIEAGLVAYLTAIAGLAIMAMHYPEGRAPARWERSAFRGLVVAMAVVGILQFVTTPSRLDALGKVVYVLGGILFTLQGPIAFFLSRQLGQGSPSQRTSTRLIVLGLGIWPAWVLGLGAGTLVEGGERPIFTTLIASQTLLSSVVVLIVVRLLRRQSDGPRRWGAPMLLTGFVALGLASAAWRTSSIFSSIYLATIVALAVVVAYGILRRDFFTLDRRVRFAISRSTVAAVFVAVFFIASEAAQQFFGETFGGDRAGAYMGIAAAGGLVFAFAPLQRVADRLAESAIPKPAVTQEAWAAATSASAGEREESYRRAVRLALRDRKVTRDEERDLLELAHHLGISPLRATAIQDQVNQGTSANGSRGPKGSRRQH